MSITSNSITVSKDIGGRQLRLEYGKLAHQATSSVLARYGDTMVLVTVVMGRDNPELGYFPLQVEYVERLYAGGKIKGSRWVKLEGKPSTEAVLTARVIDRSIRPLFPDNLTKEIQVVITELSTDKDNDSDILSLIATSAALAASPIPWAGPIGGSKIGLVDGQFVINPNLEQSEQSDLSLILSTTKDKVIMVDAEGNEVADDTFAEALHFGFDYNQEVLDLINQLVDKVNPTKITVAEPQIPSDLLESADKYLKQALESQILDEKVEFSDYWDGFKDQHTDDNIDDKALKAAFEKQWKKRIRKMIATGKRLDGRGYDDIRPISGEVDLLPRTHGSAVFNRGLTQALTVVTLGSPRMSQIIESSTAEETKRYIHHYSMPPYTVGETGRIGFPKRREVGHGALAEKALLPVIPSEDDFPYTIRVVSEIMSSNGSTSQASACGSTMALMAAGVPIKRPVAGVVVGKIQNESGEDHLLTDITGVEDFNGDMDYKVAGTTEGITAVQLDIKQPLDLELMKPIIEKARVGRLHILSKMAEVIAEPRQSISQFAPKIEQIQIDKEKIGDVIGPGGKVIRRITEETGAEIDINDEGMITITCIDADGLQSAIDWIEGLTTDPEVGAVYLGRVMRITEFGAFVEILPGKEGLVHISRMAPHHVGHPEEILKMGDTVNVKLYEIDNMNRLNLTMDVDGNWPPAPDRNGGGRNGGGHPRRDQRHNSGRGRGPRRNGFSR